MRKQLIVPCLGLALLAGGCSAPSGSESAGRAEEAALRERVERLEREDAAERQRMAGEIAALRQELETLRRDMDGQGEQGGQPQPPAKEGEEHKPAKKSPRQALKQGFNDMVAGARRTLDRLGRELDESLAKKKSTAPKAAPAPEPAPAKPEGPMKPEGPAGSGTQI